MPDQTLSLTSTSWINKLFECLFFIMAGAMVVFSILETSINDLVMWYGEVFLVKVVLAVFVAGTFLSILFTIIWQKRERKAIINSDKIHLFLQGAMRYWLAYEISLYGFAKILRTQFAPSYSRSDTPVGSLSGIELTWNYFGHSYPMVVIIACLQIGGSILLLFRRTTLTGVIILLPVMLNVILINQFYDIAAGAYIISAAITIGLFYLFLLRWPEIKAVLFRPENKVSHARWRKVLVSVLKIVVIGCAFLIVHGYLSIYGSSALEGKWKVDSLIRNKQTLKENAWVSDPNDWKNVYIEMGDKLILSPNPYITDTKRATLASYRYDSKNNKLTFLVANGIDKTDSVHVNVIIYKYKAMQWNTVFNHDTLTLYLSRVKP